MRGGAGGEFALKPAGPPSPGVMALLIFQAFQGGCLSQTRLKFSTKKKKGSKQRKAFCRRSSRVRKPREVEARSPISPSVRDSPPFPRADGVKEAESVRVSTLAVRTSVLVLSFACRSRSLRGAGSWGWTVPKTVRWGGGGLDRSKNRDGRGWGWSSAALYTTPLRSGSFRKQPLVLRSRPSVWEVPRPPLVHPPLHPWASGSRNSDTEESR